MIQPERIVRRLPGDPPAGRRYVLYWMQQSQRSRGNHALEFAVRTANGLGLPVLVVFVVAPSFPDAGRAAYRFMLDGLRETSEALRRRHVGVRFCAGAPGPTAAGFTGDAALAVMDHGYLRVQRGWRQAFISAASCPVVEVESDVVVPVETAAEREQPAAATLRPKLQRLLPRFLVPLATSPVAVSWREAISAGTGEPDPARLLPPGLGGTDRCGGAIPGESAAWSVLAGFLRDRLARYHQDRLSPAEDMGSGLSAYLHFGQISALDVALAVQAADAPKEARDGFLEELIVRRELAANFVHYNADYDRYGGLPGWCRESLAVHAGDRRPTLYSPAQLEDAQTHDPFWNAAQREMLVTGRMHNTMRMYWGKKILEWSPDPETAFGIALDLNNRYEMDGRDANGFAGVAWCFGKHDRPWPERPIFGKIRYMNDKGLQRKYDMGAYLDRVAAMEATARGGT